MKTPSRPITYDPGEINDIFELFYSHFYTAEPTPDLTALKSYLSELNIPFLTSKGTECLEVPLTLLELKETLNSMEKPDGGPPEPLSRIVGCYQATSLRFS